MKYLFSLCALLFLPSLALAEHSTARVHTKGLNSLQVTEKNTANTSSRKTLSDNIKISGSHRGIGRFKLMLSEERNFKFSGERSSVRLYQGIITYLSGGDEIRPVAANLSPNGKRLELHIFSDGEGRVYRKSRKVLRLLLKLSTEGDAKSASLLRPNKHDAECRMHRESEDIFTAKASRGLSALANREIDLQLEGDQEFFGKVADPPAKMATILNIADAWYKRDLGLAFNGEIKSNAVAYSSVIRLEGDYSVDLLNEITRKYGNNGKDVKYVMSGKSPQGDLSGIAGVVPDLGIVCKDPSNSVGLGIRFDDTFDAETLAHEVGHLFNAQHDDNYDGDPSFGFIMNSGNESTSFKSEFSSFSKSEIATYVSSNGSCLVAGDGNSSGGDTGGGDSGGGETDGGGTGGSDEDYSDIYYDFEYAVDKTDICNQTLYANIYKNDELAPAGDEVILRRKARRWRRKSKVWDASTTDANGTVAFSITKKGFYALEAGLDRSRFQRLKVPGRRRCQ